MRRKGTASRNLVILNAFIQSTPTIMVPHEGFELRPLITTREFAKSVGFTPKTF